MAKRKLGSVDPGGSVNVRGPMKADPGPILAARAAMSRAVLTPAMRMFVQFDAWSDPRLVEWIDRNKNNRKVSKSVRDMFITLRPRIKAVVLRCAFGLLTGVPLERAKMLASGQDYGIPVKVPETMAIQLGTIGLSAADLIREIATFQHKIFHKHFPPQALPGPELDLAFAHFAAGRLRVSAGPQEWMNAEPDSAYFFSFAEFCIQAAYVGASPGHEWWLSLGCLFAALQDVYCQRYHHKAGERRFEEYSDVWFDGSRVIEDDLLLKMVQSVRRRDGTLPALVERVTWNAYWYFFDNVATKEV